MRNDLQHRIQWFHRNVALGNHPTAALMSERFGISLRQAYYDINLLRSRLHAPLVFSAAEGGYLYTEPYVLPSVTSELGSADCTGLAALLDMEEEQPALAQRSTVQLQIPFRAVLQIESPLSILNFRRYLVEEEEGGRFVCEFPNLELFLSLIFTDDGEVRILEPEWLRERLCAMAEKTLRANRRPAEEPNGA
jgi:predicted DNA-binding transcriptional regulator YafY